MRRSIAVVATAACSLALAGTTSAASAGAAPPEPAPPAGAAGSAIAGGATSPVAKSPDDRYVVVMRQDPLVRSAGAGRLHTAAASSRASVLRAEQDAALRSAGLSRADKEQEYTTALNGFAVETDLAGAQRLARDPAVALVVPDALRQVDRASASSSAAAAAKTSTSLSRNGLNDYLGLTDRDEAYGSGITGSGVVVGVIDTGVWPEHPSLAPRPGLPARPVLDEGERSACAFGNTAWNEADVAFACNTKLIGAREFLDTYNAATGLRDTEFDSARDDDGHGTHTSTTAAGNADVRATVLGADRGVVSGIAPDAQVIAYKAIGSAGGYASDLVAAIDQAVADGVDVINFSLGGPPNTVSPEAIALLFAADAGVDVAASVGNAGPNPGSIGGPADLPWVTGVGATTFPTSYGGTLELDRGPSLSGASITPGTPVAPVVDGAAAGSAPCVPGALDPAVVAGAIVVCAEGAVGAVVKSIAVEQAGGLGLVVTSRPGSTLTTASTHVPTLVLASDDAATLRAWLARRPGGTGRLVSDGVTRSPVASPTVALFSGRGESPTAGDLVKPDLTAPGVQVLAGASPSPADPGFGPAGQLFQSMSGASMASPVVAGLSALLAQAHPDWTPAMVRSALVTTADSRVRDSDGSTADPFDAGSGIAALGEPASKGSAFRPGLVYDATFPDYLGFLCDEGPSPFPAAVCDDLEAIGYPTDAQNLNQPSIGVEEVPGRTTVLRWVTNVSGARLKATASVDAPQGFAVTVSPSTVDLAPGATARVTLSVVAKSSVATGRWSFGSLTWRGDGYEVRSPVALKGTDLRAPAVVTGDGGSGTASVPVEIGTRGRYEAVPHGLVPAVTTTGTVGQDPDQSFPSPDDDAGVTRLPVDLTGVAHARWTLEDDDADTDLDLYLLDASGEVVASSAEAGTAELIDLAHPAPGTYSLVVHGWAAAADTAFSVRSWLVPTSSDGSLQVTSGGSGPVRVGDSRTVGLTWSGAAPGPNLGLVEHLVDGRRLADTLVEVTG
ncbi:S8 family serine peptidase [Oryzobacter terrae]|uniref:S8 family serine peptidase n=1 Tax=Oryzobacter terrae TaxID=1620385 RepID=UPI00366B4FA3